MSNSLNRRGLLLITGGAVVSSMAGCLGDDEDNETSDENDGDNENGVNGFEIDPGTRIVIDGYIERWEGVDPAAIEGKSNPTLVLEAGGDYEMEWVNADGTTHNLEIRNADNEVIDDLVTGDVGEVGDGDSLSFTATKEMTTYICTFHEATQRGELDVR